MASLSEQNKVRELFDTMTLGVVRSLEKKPGVTDVRLLDRQPADKHIIFTWEQKNMCILPEDLKSFYLTTNGLLIQWSIKFDGSVLPLGKMELNAVASLILLSKATNISDDKPSLADLDSDTDEEDEQGHVKPHFDTRCKVFELDPCDSFGKVCLVYKDVKAGVTTSQPEVWFLDRSLEWSYLASSFMDYFRMMIVHLGLPLWQYLFTSTGLSPETKQWFNLYAPTRLAIDTANMDPDGHQKPNSTEGNQHVLNLPLNALDINRLFKGKTDKGKSKQSQTKKPPMAKTQTSNQSRSGQPGRQNQR
ncbi:tubulin polyglutamylase complex subunit 2-like [Montipora foliosa]|uniref:tubulin polyglutamylase complex subunit 2-like n=1 Tax=Montipora foliosa TaxID=591990 RepID=UPI0035F1C338